MAYFMINNQDFSRYVSGLKINKAITYNAQQNAAGDSVVDYVNSKREIEVTIIPLDNIAMVALQNAIEPFNVSISFLNPRTNMLEEGVSCIIPETEIEYYTIQANKTMFNAVTLKFIEL